MNSLTIRFGFAIAILATIASSADADIITTLITSDVGAASATDSPSLDFLDGQQVEIRFDVDTDQFNDFDPAVDGRLYSRTDYFTNFSLSIVGSPSDALANNASDRFRVVDNSFDVVDQEFLDVSSTGLFAGTSVSRVLITSIDTQNFPDSPVLSSADPEVGYNVFLNSNAISVAGPGQFAKSGQTIRFFDEDNVLLRELGINNIVNATSVPEPSSFALIGLAGSAALATRRRRKFAI